MGDTWMPDRAATLEEVLHAYILLEEDWTNYQGDPSKLLQIALTAMILIGGFSGALRGEELPKMELGAIRKHWNKAVQHVSAPHIPLVLSRWFKLTDGEKLFFLPLACRSSAGIEIRTWTQRLLMTYADLKVTSGPVFRVAHKGTKVRRSVVGDLDVLFHEIYTRVQERWPRVIPASVKVQEEYSIRQSL
jgi:hypothetical protein